MRTYLSFIYAGRLAAVALLFGAAACGDDTTASSPKPVADGGGMMDSTTPGSDASTTPGSDAGIPPGSDASIPPGSDAGIPPGSDAGIPPDSDAGIPPGSDAGIPPGSDAGSADGGPVSFASLVYPIIQGKCSGCHGPTADGGPGPGIAGGKLDMSTAPIAYAALVADGGVAAQGGACATLGNAGLKRVVAGSPPTSLFCNKVVSNDGDGGSIILADGGREVLCGNPMPLHQGALSPDQIATIKAWITSGANP